MNLITHLHEPNRLPLVWQNPEGGSRRRFIVGEIGQIDGQMTFQYLRDSEDFHDAVAAGFKQHPAFRPSDDLYTRGVADVFMRRLPPRNRIDFRKYLEILRLPHGSSVSDLTLLAYSGAKLPSDGFSVVHPFNQIDSDCEFVLEVAGFRYQHGVQATDIAIGEAVEFVREPDNPVDPMAVAIYYLNQRIGYVNRIQVGAFHSWMDRGMQIFARVDRLNGRSDRPLVYLFVEVRDTNHEIKNIAL